MIIHIEEKAMTEQLFEKALGIETPWHVKAVRFDAMAGELTIEIDFARGSRFHVEGEEGSHAAYDTEERRYRHMNFFQHRCELVVRLPRVELPDGRKRTVEAPWSGHLRGFTLLMEAFVFLLVSSGMTFAEAARVSGVSSYQAKEIVVAYTEEAVNHQDLSGVLSIAIDETSKSRGHHLLHARVTIDKYHVVHHATAAVDLTRRHEQRSGGYLKGLRWTLVKAADTLTDAEWISMDHVVRYPERSRTARAWQYKEELRAILKRKQSNVVGSLLQHWCRCVMRSKVVAMKPVAKMIRRHVDAIVNWTRSRITNGFLESLHSKFQAAKRRAHGYRNFRTIRAVYFMLAGKLNYANVNQFVLPT